MNGRPCSIANFGLTARRVDVQLTAGDLVQPGYGSNRMCSTARELFKDMVDEQQQPRWWLWSGDDQKHKQQQHDPVLVRAAQHGPLFSNKLLLVGG